MTMPLSFRFPPARAVVLALLLAALLSAFLLADSVPALGSGGVDLEAVELPPLRYPNLGSRLSWMAQDVEDGTATEADAAARAVEYDGTSVGVRITFSAGQEALGNFLAEVGGSVDYVSGNLMNAWVPVAALGRLSRLPITVEVRESVPPQPAGTPAMGRVKSQGVRLHGADVWRQAGHTGSGVKVGVLDVGFAGFADLVRSGELPRPVGVYCGAVKVSNPNGVSDSQIDACALDRAEDPESHGTATAETIVDMAPGVQLYISNVNVVDATRWFSETQVDVDLVNASLKWPFYSSPLDSSGPVKGTIKSYIGTKSVLWVNAAGNDADGASWFSPGPFLDQDGDGYIEFQPGDESNAILLQDSSWVGLRWDPAWQGSAQNIGLFVHDGYGVVNERMSSYGSGRGSHRRAGIYCEFVYPCVIQLGIRVTGTVSYPSWIQLEISHFERLQYFTSDSSMGNPGEMSLDGFLAVGASGYRSSGTVIERYSSRGPVPGATYKKPDLVGVSCTDSLSIHSPFDSGPTGYCGTSNASPHVAGLAALVMGRNPRWTNVQVAKYLKDNSVHPRGRGPDDVWGHGFVKLPSDFRVAGRYSLHPRSGPRGRFVTVLPPTGSPVVPFKVCYDIAGSDCVQSSVGVDAVGGADGIVFQVGRAAGSGDVTLYVHEAVRPPGIPVSVSAVQSGSTVSLFWAAPLSDGGSPITRYEYREEGSSVWMPVGLVLTTDVQFSGTAYTFYVRACNITGCGGSNWVANPPVTSMGAPAGVSLVRSDGAVTASWPAVAGATKYHVTYTTDVTKDSKTWMLFSVDHAGNRATITADNSKSYIVGVRAGNDSGDWGNWRNSSPSGLYPPLHYFPPSSNDSSRVLVYRVVPSCTLTPSSGSIGDSFSVSCTDVDDAHDYFVMDGATELSRGRSSRGNARFDLTTGSPNSGNSYSFTLEYGENRARGLELSFAFSMGCTVSRTDGTIDGHGPGVLYREDSFDLVCAGLPEGAEYEVHGGTGRSVYRGISHLAVGGRALDGVISHTLTPKPPFTERLRGGPLYYELEVRPKYGGFSTLRAGVMVLPIGKVTPSSAAPGEPFLFEVMDMLAVGAVYVRNGASGERSNVACYGTSGVRGRAGRDGVASLDLLLPQGLEPGDYELEAYSLNFVSGSGEKCADFDALPGAPYNLVVARVDFTVDRLKMQISPGTLVRGQRATASGYGFSQLESGQEVIGFHFFGEGGVPCPPPAAPPWDPDYYKGLLCWASGIALDLASVDVDYSGFYSVEFVVPLDVPPSAAPELGGDEYFLNAVSRDGAESRGDFILLEPALVLSESASRRGLKITVDGTGFPARRPVTLHHGEGDCPEYSGAPMSAVAGHVLSGADGSFSVGIEVPREPATGEYRYGDFLVTAVSGPYDGPQFKQVVACGSVEHSVPFPQVTLRPSPASPGIPLRIEGEFFQPYTSVDSVEVLSYTLPGSNARVDGEGRFVADTTLPDILAVGVYPLRVHLSDGTFIGFRIRVAKPGEVGVDAELMFRDFGDVLEDVWVYDHDAGVWRDIGFGQEGSSSILLPGDLVALSLGGAATYKGESYGPGLHILFVESY